MTNAYSDNLNNYNGPKGNLADFRHASRMFVENNFALAPKFKFLYHVFFSLDPSVANIIPSLVQKYTTEIGLLVKSAELPKFAASIETKNKYNRKKHVQTNISYDPINVSFHDDNQGITTALLEAYYRFYYADAWHGDTPGAYSKTAGGTDNTYMGTERQRYRYGLDNNISVPFFNNIQISQLSRNQYTTYTLVNPIISNWSHDSVASDDNSTGLENNITIQYEAVHYSRGQITADDSGDPAGFGTEHYDKQPSPLQSLSVTNEVKTDTFPVRSNTTTRSVFQGFNLQAQTQNPNYGISNATSSSSALGGFTDLNIPVNNGTGGANDITETKQYNSNNIISSNTLNRNELESNSIKLNDLAKADYLKDYLAEGGDSGINGATDAWNNLPLSVKNDYKNAILDKSQ